MKDIQMSESDGGPAEVQHKSLWQWFIREARQQHDATALVALHQAPEHLSTLLTKPDQVWSADHFTWTYGQLLEAVENLAAFWSESGIKPNDKVFTLVNNSAEWALFFWACMRLGTTFVPLDASVLNRNDEIQWLISDLKPAIVLASNAEDAEMYDRFGGREKLKIVCGKSSNALHAWHRLSDLAARKSTPAAAPLEHFERVALFMLTSGTTSRPKICPVTERGIIAQITQYHLLKNSRWDRQTKFLINTSCFRPICYLACLSTWQRGGTVVFAATTFDPKIALQALISQQCTHTWMVPAQVKMIAAFAESTNTTPSTLKSVIVSGDTIDGDTVARGQRALRPQHFLVHWGMSEGAPLFGFQAHDSEPKRDADPIGLGRALPGTRVRIAEPGTRSPVPRGTSGELHVSSTSMINGYLGNANAEDFYEDEHGRWFVTGDLAFMDSSGVVAIDGRTKDIIKCKGFGIVPSIVERYLDTTFEVEVSCRFAWWQR